MRRSLAVVLVLLATTTAALAADLDVVRQNFVAYYSAGGAPIASQRMSDALGALESHARSLTAAGYLRSDGSWPDINYDETPSGGWSPWAHTQRLMIMAKAYRTPGQSLYRDAQLRAQINAALVYTKTFYGANKLPLGNWWFWTIGIPIDLGPTLVLMRDDIDATTYNDLVAAIQLRIGNSPTARGISGPIPTGENLVWSSFTHLCLALLKDDPVMLAAVRDAMASVTLPTTAEGIKSDQSFHQHGAQLYTGGYGGSFANDVAKYALITRGTSYELPDASLNSFAAYIADGIAWTMYGNYFDVSVISREVARETTNGYNGMAALLQASQFASPRANEIRAAAAKVLQTWQGALPTEFAALAASIESSNITASWPSGHRHYYNSDYTVHRRDGWFASVKMFSTRTKSGESTNEENLHGARQSDGRFYLVLDGDQYFGRDVWPAFDWTRLPGTTVEQKADTANASYGYGTRTLAGGTGDGRNGVSAMDLAPLNSLLTAKKAWIFFDDAIVFLTSSITAPSANRIETIVNQWPLMRTTSQVTSGSDWSVLENVGYWFPSAQNVKTSRDSRTGAWSDLGGSSDTTPRTREFVTMWIDHGTNPVNATAEYVIVPNVSATAMRDWASARPLQILANNAIAAGARDLRNGNTGITFWSAGTVDGITSSAASVVYLTTSGNQMHVWAADPNAGASGTFQLTIPGAWTASGATSSSTIRSTTLTIPRNGGKTTHVVLTKALGKSRAVRRR
ncbi:MAG TPA: polysaccharide lyase family 8 super-sandwich domain-containing protein [Thermoanaerobaculia bacterium]|nr:polysaccharide lyase family 8 super-sandwich domain-containing protein [Thermoanaerobaculia bacterium]